MLQHFGATLFAYTCSSAMTVATRSVLKTLTSLGLLVVFHRAFSILMASGLAIAGE